MESANTSIIENLVPENTSGTQKDFEERLSTKGLQNPFSVFLSIKEKLLNINNWQRYNEISALKFQIVDRQAQSLLRPLKQGDVISIASPAPGISTGEGKDWVKAEKIETVDTKGRELIALTLRPIAHPQHPQADVAHFFSPSATSTIIIRYTGNEIIASYHGRNEEVNVETDKLTDKLRNIMVGATALLGFSDLQWKGLLKGFLHQ